MDAVTPPEQDGQFCTFHLGPHYFAVSVTDVQEVFQLQEITPVPRAAPGSLGNPLATRTPEPDTSERPRHGEQ